MKKKCVLTPTSPQTMIFNKVLPLVLLHYFTKDLLNALWRRRLFWRYGDEQVMISAHKYFRSEFLISVDTWVE